MQRNLILALVFALLIAVFAMQNAVPVTLTFFTYTFETSLVVVVLGTLAVGALIMGLFSSFQQLKLKKEKRQLEGKCKIFERELKNKEEKISKLESKLDNTQLNKRMEIDEEDMADKK